VRRREFIVLLGGAATWPFAAHAQQTRLVGILMNGNANEPNLQANVKAFTQGLADLGWVEGKNLRLEIRWNGGNAERARSFASELTTLSPAAIMSASTTNLLALRNATSTIPIVFLQVSDPVAQGFVSNLTKPGGNATGFSAYEFSIGGKWLELLKEIAPRLTHVAMMVNPDTAPQSRFFMKAIEAAAPAFSMRVEAAPVRAMSEIERAIEVAGQQGNGIIIPTDSYTRTRGAQIAEIALKRRVPVIGAFPEFIDQGGLMYYGPSSVENLAEQYRQAATYADRILKGAKPGDLPIQGATKFSLFINRKTATAFGLEIPPRLLFTADRVIE
jgi:putative tryptophan/tyrosine transport system substrate-binding protein